MQSVNGAQFLNIIFLFPLKAAAILVFGIVVVPLTHVLMHEYNYLNPALA